jgi:hypothetical protein
MVFDNDLKLPLDKENLIPSVANLKILFNFMDTCQ